MAAVICIILCSALTLVPSALPRPTDSDIITQPKPGQEYVFLQSSDSNAKPVARKDKFEDQGNSFETAHKFPESIRYTIEEYRSIVKPLPKQLKRPKRGTSPAERTAPAPAGAIKLDVQKLLEKYKTELKTSSTTTAASTTKKSRRASNRNQNKRIKKDAKDSNGSVSVTSPRTTLTTGASAPKKINDDNDDISFIGAGSEKQRSRIQIKKGPNGQEYEYEYVYYYYDDDEDSKDQPKVSNSHDGPPREKIRSSAVNEVIPAASRSKPRGRELGEEDITEERLPANTRFPPRSRKLNTTPLPEVDVKPYRQHGREKGTTENSSASSEAGNIFDDTQGSRGRTRSNVRRPSLDLVDNESFNTHTNTAGSVPPSGGPSFPSELPAGPVRFLGATPNESVDLPSSPESPKKDDRTENVGDKENASVNPDQEESTTSATGMNKVALDLYAVVQGTQKLSGEDDANLEETFADEHGETTLEPTTEEIMETTPTTSTTTTTTTTTTPDPTTTTTTTTTTEATIGRGRFRGRGRKTTSHASTTEAAHTDAKHSKPGRPKFGRPKLGGRTSTEEPEQEVAQHESKPVGNSRPTLTRGRFGTTRTRTRTTSVPSEESPQHKDYHQSTAAPSFRPSLRPRPGFNIRSRSRATTTSSSDSDSAVSEGTSNSEPASTTSRTRRIQGGGAVRPLRPGPRINLARGRPGVHTTTEAAVVPEEDHITGDETPPSQEENEKEETPAAPVDNSALGRLRNKSRLDIVASRPKAAASTPVQVRRVNPLLARRRPGQITEATSSETPQEISTEASSEDIVDTEAPEPSSSTTEEPRGLNKLLAGRRRLTARQPGALRH